MWKIYIEKLKIEILNATVLKAWVNFLKNVWDLIKDKCATQTSLFAIFFTIRRRMCQQTTVRIVYSRFLFIMFRFWFIEVSHQTTTSHQLSEESHGRKTFGTQWLGICENGRLRKPVSLTDGEKSVTHSRNVSSECWFWSGYYANSDDTWQVSKRSE